MRGEVPVVEMVPRAVEPRARGQLDTFSAVCRPGRAHRRAYPGTSEGSEGRARPSGEPPLLVSRGLYESYPCPAVSGRRCDARSVAMSIPRRLERQPGRGAGSAAGGAAATAGFIDISTRRDGALGKKRSLPSRIPRPGRRALEPTAARQGPISARVARHSPHPGEVSAYLTRPRSGFRRIRRVSRVTDPALAGFDACRAARNWVGRPESAISDAAKSRKTAECATSTTHGAVNPARGVVLRVELADSSTKDGISAADGAWKPAESGTLAGRRARSSTWGGARGEHEARCSAQPTAMAGPAARDLARTRPLLVGRLMKPAPVSEALNAQYRFIRQVGFSPVGSGIAGGATSQPRKKGELRGRRPGEPMAWRGRAVVSVLGGKALDGLGHLRHEVLEVRQRGEADMRRDSLGRDLTAEEKPEYRGITKDLCRDRREGQPSKGSEPGTLYSMSPWQKPPA